MTALDTERGRRSKPGECIVPLRKLTGSRTNLWRECISIAYVARTNWQMDREIDVQGNGMFISFFVLRRVKNQEHPH